MSVLATTHPTLTDAAKRTDPDGKIADIVEILNQTNEINEDVVWIEGNLATGHRTTIRTGIPLPTWRRLYEGVDPSRSTTVQVTDNCGMLDNYAEVDKALADLNGNTAAFRLSEERPIIEGFGQEVAQTIFYGNEGTAPAEFTGLAPRYNTVTLANAQSADNVIDAGGAGSDNMSMWVVVWGPNTIHGIYPKGTKAGLDMQDKGQVTSETAGGVGKLMEVYRSYYTWKCGLTVRDWRYAVRVCNISKAALKGDLSSGPNLVSLLTRAIERIPNLSTGRAAIYANRTVRETLREQIVNVKNVRFGTEEVAGKRVMMFDGIPFRRCDQLLETEARVT